MSDAWDEYDDEYEEEEEAPHRAARRRTRGDTRGNLYLITGLVIGLAIGLVIAWVVSPIKYVNTDPTSLSATYKDEYRRVVALAYNAEHDLGRARVRLGLLGPQDPVQALASEAQHMLAENQSAQEARALAVLAADLSRPEGVVNAAPSAQTTAVAGSEQPTSTAGTAAGTSTQEVAAPIQTPTLPPPTLTPTATLTPLPTFPPTATATPVRVLDAPFTMKSKKEVCAADATAGLLQIEVSDADGKPLPGVQIMIAWENKEDTFYTGLSPEINPGYADFQMSPATAYTLKVGEASKSIDGVSIPSCGGGLKMEFEQAKQ